VLWSRRRGLSAVYLLTEDSEAFFSRLGFLACPRGEVPASIRASREFARDCPDSAAVMVLRLTEATKAGRLPEGE
jgi:N-acetylglutamate synthase-like GNAT family acetyltransferase